MIGAASSEQSLPSDELAVPTIHAAQRSWAWVSVLVAMSALFLAGLASPGIAATVGVSLERGALAVGVFLGMSTLALLSFYRFGAASRIYRCCDYLEGFALSWSIAYLIQSSSGVHSLFWIFHGAQVLATAFGEFSLIYCATVCAGPAYLVIVCLARGDTASAWFTALAGAAGLAIYLVVARLSSERNEALRREAGLRRELGRFLIARERARISRNLHDNVATELTALVWKVREISSVATDAPYAHDLASVADRLRSVIADLRNVVLELRAPELSFSELRLLLEQRCRELCGTTLLRVTIHGQLAAEELTSFHEHVLPLCFELVSNAAHHASARHVELDCEIGSRLCVRVSDDGSGLSAAVWHASRGGLSGVRQRCSELGGSASLEKTAAGRGTRIVVEVPRPLLKGSASDARLVDLDLKS